MGDWAPFVAILAVLTAIASLAMNFINNSATKLDAIRSDMLSIREHNEFKLGLESRLLALDGLVNKKAPTARVKEYKKDLLRELKLLRSQVNEKPSVGELKGSADALKEQLLALERRIQESAQAAAYQRTTTASALADTHGK